MNRKVHHHKEVNLARASLPIHKSSTRRQRLPARFKKLAGFTLTWGRVEGNRSLIWGSYSRPRLSAFFIGVLAWVEGAECPNAQRWHEGER
jgi:hypothetical protein